MGVIPLQFIKDENIKSHGLTGNEVFDILNLEDLTPNKIIKVRFTRHGGSILEFSVIARLDSSIEIAYFQNGVILQHVLRKFLIKNIT